MFQVVPSGSMPMFPRLIGCPAHWIPQLIDLSAEAIQFVTGPWAGNGQTNQRSSDGQTDEWSSAGQTNRWSSRAKSSNCEEGVNWPVVKCWSTDQWSSDGQTDQWSSYGQTDLWSSGNETDRTLWPTIDHWYVWPSIKALLCDNLTLGSNEPGEHRVPPIPSFLAVSSCHLLLGRPVDLFPLLGCHSVQRLVHLLSFILAHCSAHLHFPFSVYSIMSI